MKILEKFKNKEIYLSPNNELSQKFKIILDENINYSFKGFLDKKTLNKDFHIEQGIIIISSPNFYKEITKDLSNISSDDIDIYYSRFSKDYFKIYHYMFTLIIYYKLDNSNKILQLVIKKYIKNYINKIKNYINKIKKSSQIRFLKNYIEQYIYKFYKANHSMSNLKNIYKGKTCLILGNGPSLKDIDNNLLRKYITFGSNGIFLKYTPDLYITISKEFYKNYIYEIKNLKTKFKFIDYRLEDIICDETIKLTCSYPVYGQLINKNFPVPLNISKEPDKLLYLGGTVIFAQVQIAVWMGFSEIILLGVDHTMSNSPNKEYGGTILSKEDRSINHFSNQYISGCHCDYLAIERSFLLSKNFCKKHNVRLINATKNTKLNIIEKGEIYD